MKPLVISNEEFQQALNWINGQQPSLQQESVREMVGSLVRSFRQRITLENPGVPVPRLRKPATSPLSLRSLLGDEADTILKDMKEIQSRCEAITHTEQLAGFVQEDGSPLRGEHADLLDSVMLLDSIAHVSENAGYLVTQSKAQLILYCLYGCRLAYGGERLEIEHPQMWKYGPVFPRAYKKSHLGDSAACESAFMQLRNTVPDLCTALEAKTYSMMGTPMEDLNAAHKGPMSPYGRLLKENPQRWGLQIPDERIAEYFSRNRC